MAHSQETPRITAILANRRGEKPEGTEVVTKFIVIPLQEGIPRLIDQSENHMVKSSTK